MAEIVLWIVRGIYRILFGKIEIIGIENIPRDRNFLVTPNHLSNFDPPLIAAFMPVRMSYMAKAALFKVPIVAQVIKGFGAFPVNGGGDIAAVRTAIGVLKGNKNLVVFPEGKRIRTAGVLGAGKNGAAMIALKAGVGILPVGIETSYKLRSGIRVTIGNYIDLSEYNDTHLRTGELQRITDSVIMPQIAELAGAKVYGN